MVNVIIEPYEPIVNSAISLIEQREPGYFSNIDKIVVEFDDKGHLGRVETDKPNTIFISVGKIKSALSNASEEDKVLEVAKTLAHEMGHLKSDFQGGEVPAELEESRIENVISRLKTANVETISSYEVALAVLTVIKFFAQKVKPENKKSYLSRIKNKVRAINALEISNRNKNPSAGIGAAISLIKNLLAGHSHTVSSEALSMIYYGIDNI